LTRRYRARYCAYPAGGFSINSNCVTTKMGVLREEHAHLFIAARFD